MLWGYNPTKDLRVPVWWFQKGLKVERNWSISENYGTLFLENEERSWKTDNTSFLNRSVLGSSLPLTTIVYVSLGTAVKKLRFGIEHYIGCWTLDVPCGTIHDRTEKSGKKALPYWIPTRKLSDSHLPVIFWTLLFRSRFNTACDFLSSPLWLYCKTHKMSLCRIRSNTFSRFRDAV